MTILDAILLSFLLFAIGMLYAFLKPTDIRLIHKKGQEAEEYLSEQRADAVTKNQKRT